MNRNFIQCKIHKDEKNTVRSDSSVHPWMRMFLRVRINNLILEVVVDHPNQSFNRTVKIHCRWLDYVLSDAGRFLSDSNIRYFRNIYISIESLDAHAVETIGSSSRNIAKILNQSFNRTVKIHCWWLDYVLSDAGRFLIDSNIRYFRNIYISSESVDAHAVESANRQAIGSSSSNIAKILNQSFNRTVKIHCWWLDYVLSDAGRFLIDSNIRYFRNIYISSESVDAHAVESANRQGDIGSGCRSSKSGVFLQPLDHHQIIEIRSVSAAIGSSSSNIAKILNQSFNRTVKIHCWWLDYVLSDAGRFLIDSNIRYFRNIYISIESLDAHAVETIGSSSSNIAKILNQSFNRTAKIHCRWLDYVLSDAGRFLIDSNIRNLRIIYTSESVDAHAVESANRQGDIGSGCRSSKSGVFLQPLDHHQIIEIRSVSAAIGSSSSNIAKILNQSFNRTVKIHCWWLDSVLSDAGRFLIDSNIRYFRNIYISIESLDAHAVETIGSSSSNIAKILNQSFNRTAKIHCRWLDYVLSDAGRFLIDSNIRNLRIIYTSESVDAHAVESANRQGDIGSGCRSSKSGVFLQPLDHHQIIEIRSVSAAIGSSSSNIAKILNQSFNRTVKIHCWWLDYVLSDAGRFLIDSNIRYFRNIYISSESVDAHAVESANRQGDIGSGCRSSKSGVFLQPLDHHQVT
ncbi:Protein translocase subunit SecD [Trichinella pseudospiralis]